MSASSMSRQDLVAKNTVLMTLGTLFSRATGLVRTWFMAFALGASLTASAYQVANNIPNIIYELVAGGLISAAFLPVLVSCKQESREQGDRYASNILNLTAVSLSIVSLLAIFLAEPLVYTQTFTVDASSVVPSRAVGLFRIFAFQVLFYGIGGIATGMLNAERTFFITALAPALNNLVVIASFIAYAVIAGSSPDTALVILAAGTTLGVIVQAAVQIPAIVKSGFIWKPVLELRAPSLKETMKIALPSIAFVITSLVSVSARNAFSLVAGDSGPAMIAYAWLWFQLPYGVVAVSLSQTMFTELSESAAKEDKEAFSRYVSGGLKTSLLLMLPLCACLFALADPLMGLFRAGAFTEGDLAATSALLRIWALGLPSYTVFMYLYRAFAALRKMGRFAAMNAVAVGVQIALYATLSSTQLGIFALPLADIGYYTFAAAASALMLRKLAGSSLGLVLLLPDVLKTLTASIAACLLMMAMLLVLPAAIEPLTSLWELALCGVMGVVAAIGIAHLIGIRDFSRLLGSFLTRIRSQKKEPKS